jgi:hypothetical protein
MTTTTTATTPKELVIVSGDIKGEVEITETDTLKDVRALILEEFDDDMLPCQDFCFHVNDIRISEKQERKKLAWDLSPKRISLHSKQGIKRKLEASSTHEQDTPKRGRSEHENHDEMSAPAATLACASIESPPNEFFDASNTALATQSIDSSINSNSSTSTSTTKDASFYSCEQQEQETQVGSEEQDQRQQKLDLNASETTDSPMPCKRLNYQENKQKDTQEAPPQHQPTALDTPGLAKEDVAFVESTNDKQEAPQERQSTVEDFAQSETANDDLDDDEKTLEMMNADEEPSDNDNELPSVDPDTSDTVVVETADINNVDQGEISNIEDDDDDQEDQDDIIAEDAPPEVNPHKENSQALEKSVAVLHQVKSILDDNPLFCSQDRRQEWTQEITDILSKAAPKTSIGVLGNTGVGKSSLLNAILDEAAVLPTSGSRGCTAAVVELSFNADLKKAAPLLQAQDDDETAITTTPVYKGKVEFIRHQEWMTELAILVDECSTEDKKIYARPPDAQRQPEAFNAWAKINQVYGRGTLENHHGKASAGILQRLATNPRVTNLLTPPPGSTDLYHSILVEQGQVDLGSANAQALVGGFHKMNTRMRRSQKRWAAAFRNQINGYVYRKGNGHEPQTWPLIRKVVLEGPWPVLSTGACLVDLPGVRDANAARAKVSEQYLQHCHQIWVVAPIKRAVDDGTAKELLGEQFKRRLLMDGQYGNVSFICTQTDDCETTEIMRDHQDVAMRKPGRWEQMTILLDDITTLEKDINDFTQQQEDLKTDIQDADDMVKESQEALKEASAEGPHDDEVQVEIDMDHLEALSDEIDANQQAARALVFQLDDFKKSNSANIKRMQRKCPKLQRTLKAICAEVRNEYSTKCLQEDFQAGLKDLTHRDDEEQGGDAAPPQMQAVLPNNFQMEVYCISSNDYLKIQGIKPASDGQANTFSRIQDTQIPQLRTFVHETTARFGETFSKDFVHHASDMLDRVKLLATDAANVPSGRSSIRCMKSFQEQVQALAEKIQPIVDDFTKNADQRVKRTLEPSLKAGAAKGSASAMNTVVSWGSTSRRSRGMLRSPDQNGLYWATYNATVRRDGAYVSGSAGEIDLNQELCDPMEKEFSTDWQRTMDSNIRQLLAECETKVNAICASVNEAIVSKLAEEGVDKARLSNMSNAASRSCVNAVKASFDAMRTLASETQRNLNRSLLPLVQERMKEGYTAANNVVRGTGVFKRIKTAIEGNARDSVTSMFDQSTLALIKGIDGLIKDLVRLIVSTGESVNKHLESVYSICWDDQQQSDKTTLVDPVQQQKVRECRDRLLPGLNKLCDTQDDARELVGMERKEVDIDVMAVETFDSSLERKLEAAASKGQVIDLCDSDDEVPTYVPAASDTVLAWNVKPEPGLAAAAVTAPAAASDSASKSKYRRYKDPWQAVPPRPETSTLPVDSESGMILRCPHCEHKLNNCDCGQ